MSNLAPPPARLVWTVWGVGAALFLIGFYHRVAPAVITGRLMQEFNLSAAALGNLSAFYFYSYAAMQIPTGVLADTWGPRRLLTMGAFITGLGTLLFALAPTILWANVGRLLVGGAVAVAFVCTLKLAAHWLAPRQFALASGLTLFIGLMGAISAGVPLQLLTAAYGWRFVMGLSAIPAFVLCLITWFIVRDDPGEKGYASYAYTYEPNQAQRSFKKPVYSAIFTSTLAVLSYRNSWLLSLIPAGIVGGVLTFSGLWGVPFLTTHYELSSTQAASMTSALLTAWAVGGPLFGVFSDRIGRRKPLFIAGCLIALLGWSLIIFVPKLSITLLAVLLIMTGFGSGCMVISYVFIKESVSPHLAGTASGLCNMGVMLGPLFLQPAVGWVLDQNWQGQMLNGIRIYGQTAYQAGFSLILAWVVLAFILLLFTRETHCRQADYPAPDERAKVFSVTN